jgi:hypothetical protein
MPSSIPNEPLDAHLIDVERRTLAPHADVSADLRTDAPPSGVNLWPAEARRHNILE